jgi:pantoate--beta-alanine ligase
MAADIIGQRQGVTLEYLEIVDPDEMQPVQVVNRPVVAAGAVWIGSTRLIDNVVCVPPA